MTYSPRFSYHSFMRSCVGAMLGCLLLAGCFSPLPEADEEDDMPDAASSPAAPAKPAPSPRAPRAENAPPPEPYGPPSRMTPSQDTPAPTGTGNYAPPTRLGEAAVAPTVKVGLLLPLSGPSAPLGQSLLDGAVLALYDKYASLAPRDITAKLELLPEDTGDSVDGAEKAVQDALQSGATLIIGPVFSKQVPASAALAQRKLVPMITFSNNSAVAGEGVYLFGFQPEQQVSRIVEYAIKHKVTHVAALAPSNPYGAAIIKGLTAEMRKSKSHARPVEYYQENLEAIDHNIRRLARFFKEEPATGQSLLIAEGGEHLKTLIAQLNASGIAPGSLQLLGTGLWDDPALLHTPTLYGAWFASSPPEKYHSFEQHFASVFSYVPERRASLAYDAVALAATLAIVSHGQGFPKPLLLDPQGFSGPANGIFRLHEDGSIERGLVVLGITAAGFTILDDAEPSFE